ncbi:MAG: ABC transporter ATP-binding protein, partial [Bacteroidota bacterium]
MLTAVGIRKSYGALQILKGIDLEVHQGEIVSIVGSSGAGKTTLLQILGTLDKPDSGELIIDGIKPFKLSSSELSAFRNRSIGFIFQFHQLLPEFSALENICMPAMIGGLGLSEARKRALMLLEKLNLQQRADHK